MNKRLTIGVTEPSQFTQECIYTIEELFDANPVKLCQNKQENLAASLEQCDGVILAGGVDIHPQIYGESVQNNMGFVRFDQERDYRELFIIDYCIEHSIPVLGICRGHQMMGVFHGFEMVVDLADSPLCHQPKNQNIMIERNQTAHAITLLCDKEIKFPEETIKVKKVEKEKDGKKRLWVNSFHHQGLLYEKKMPGIKILATAIGLREQEIVELMTGEKWVSCQWHPEYDWQSNTVSRTVLEHFGKMLSK